MRKTITLFTLFLLLVSSVVIEPTTTLGAKEDLKQIEKDRKQVKSNLSEKEKEIVKVLDEVESLHEEIINIEKELAEQDQHINETEEEILKHEEEFQQLVEQINELNELIEARTDILNSRLAAYQESGGDINFLEVILNAKSFLDFISRVSSVTTLTGADKQIIEEQINNKQEIEDIQNTIIEKIEKQEELIEDLEQTKTDMSEKQASLKQSEKKLKEKEANLKKEKEKLTKEDSELNQLEKNYRNRMKSLENEQIKVVSAEKKSSSSKAAKPNTNRKLNVGQTLRMEATAYTPNCAGCSGVTATGINVKNDKEQKIIAVDPSVIPLGSRVWVEGYGEAIAGDTGGAIKGNRIDVLFKSKSAATQWGRRTVTVKILN